MKPLKVLTVVFISCVIFAVVVLFAIVEWMLLMKEETQSLKEDTLLLIEVQSLVLDHLSKQTTGSSIYYLEEEQEDLSGRLHDLSTRVGDNEIEHEDLKREHKDLRSEFDLHEIYDH